MTGSTLQIDSTLFETNLLNVTDFDCFEVSKQCVLVAGNIAKVVSYEGGTIKVNETNYGQFSSKQLTDFVWMKTCAIKQSNYFLVGITSVIGLQRWNIENATSYSIVDLQPGFGGKDKIIRNLVVVEKTPYVLISAFGYKGIVSVDFTLMTVKNSHAELPSGIMCHLQKDLA